MAITNCNCFRQMRHWKVVNLAHGKEISTLPFGTEKENYHLQVVCNFLIDFPEN